MLAKIAEAPAADCDLARKTLGGPADVDGASNANAAMMKSASAAYAHAVFMNPTSAAAWQDLGLAEHARAAMANEPSAAGARLLEAAVCIEPANAELWNALGSVQSEPRRAQHAFIRSLELDPKLCQAWDNLGALYLQHDQGALASQAFEESKRVNPASPASWTGLARCLQAQGNMHSAMFEFQQSLLLDPSQPQALLGFAACVVALAQTEQVRDSDVHAALAHVCQYLQLAPADAHAANLCGLLYMRLDKPDHAAVALERCLGLVKHTRFPPDCAFTLRERVEFCGSCSWQSKARGSSPPLSAGGASRTRSAGWGCTRKPRDTTNAATRAETTQLCEWRSAGA